MTIMIHPLHLQALAMMMIMVLVVLMEVTISLMSILRFSYFIDVSENLLLHAPTPTLSWALTTPLATNALDSYPMPHNPSLMSPPDDVYLISNKVKVISLLFATDAEYISFPCIMSNYKEIIEVTAIVRQSLTRFIMQVIVPTTPNTENNPVVSFDILFCQPGEISKGNGQTLPHPESIHSMVVIFASTCLRKGYPQIPHWGWVS